MLDLVDDLLRRLGLNPLDRSGARVLIIGMQLAMIVGPDEDRLRNLARAALA